MRILRICIWLGLLGMVSAGAGRSQTAQTQSPAQGSQGVPSAPAAAPLLTIDQYMHQAWGTLSRSMSECSSLVDPKLTTAPVLYLPAELPAPPEVAALHSACGVRVEHLPKRIEHPGDLNPSDLKVPGLLYLPKKYVVPGGRFNEMYGWDSYFIILGLLEDERLDLARGMVENFFFEIEHYGNILNANRTYYFTRSQPPFLSSMIRSVYEADISATPQGYKTADAWLRRAYEFAVRDHDLWLTPPHRAGETGLARYHDLGVGPVPEMEDASDYYPDILRWLLAHPEVKTSYLVDGPAMLGEGASDTVLAKLSVDSCDPRISKVCARSHIGTHWLSARFYEGDRADRESGFDPTFRFGPYAGSTEDYAPVCLNALLYKYEMDLAWMAGKLGKLAEAEQWKRQAAARRQNIDKYLWNQASGLYFDYDFTTRKQSRYEYITTFYPLWAGVASPDQAKAVQKHVGDMLRPGGLAMSTYESGLQWDLPFGWAPTMWIADSGLAQTGDLTDAREIARRFMHTIEANYAGDHTVREKYNMVDSSADVKVATGYKMNVVGLGWTNAAYLKMKHLLSVPDADVVKAAR